MSFFAYLDPGAGSVLIQSIIAGVLGLIVTLKIYWSRLLNFVRRRGRSHPSPKDETVSS